MSARRGQDDDEQEETFGLDEIEAPAPNQNPEHRRTLRSSSQPGHNRQGSPQSRRVGTPLSTPGSDTTLSQLASQSKYNPSTLDHNDPQQEATGLDELDAPPPDENPEEGTRYRHRDLEDERNSQSGTKPQAGSRRKRLVKELRLTSYLVFFSIFGVLARLGIVALTIFPGAPVATTAVWANTAGCFIMGFLREDRMLHRQRKGGAWSVQETQRARTEGHTGMGELHYDGVASKDDDYVTSRSQMHSFIGLTVGFCGTFTSFADIIRDVVLAITNDLDTASTSSRMTTDVVQSRNDGYSVLAAIAILWVELSLSIAALNFGAHIAIATRPLDAILPTFRFKLGSDTLMLVLGYGTWAGAVCLTIWSPYETWRGQVLFAVVFAPVGALLRFHLARYLNRRIPSFPLGTYIANVLGTCVLGMVLDLQHLHQGQALIPCQVLQGIGDGFCGGLTTVSTWVLELDTLKRQHAYRYAAVTLGSSIMFMIAIMGPLRWSQGHWELSC